MSRRELLAFVVPARQARNRFLGSGSFKGLQDTGSEFHDCFRDREKMSRRELLDIAIKYINFLNTLIKMQQNEEI
jgi:hypothetical protein